MGKSVILERDKHWEPLGIKGQNKPLSVFDRWKLVINKRKMKRS
jgi:hypothetical protein